MLLHALHAYFRMYIAGQSLDLDDARALWAPLPLDDVDTDERARLWSRIRAAHVAWMAA